VTESQAKILVIRGGAIGDFILTLPAIAALRQRFPGACLEVLGYPHIAQLAMAGGMVDGLQPIEARGLATFFASDGELDNDFADYFSEFDLIVSYLYDPDGIFRMNIGRCTSAQFIQGPHRPDEDETVHASKVYLQPLERLAIFDADPVPRLSLNARPSMLHRLALHPGSGSESKNWPEENWAKFLEHLVNSTSLNLFLVGGEAEGERLQRLARTLPPERREVAQSLPLVELAQKLQVCTAFVGHHSGISHLAAALGLPCLVLWADTVEEVWRPQGEHVRVLNDNHGLYALRFELVWKIVRELLAA
jgi:heptosyltransferase-3